MLYIFWNLKNNFKNPEINKNKMLKRQNVWKNKLYIIWLSSYYLENNKIKNILFSKTSN